MSKAKQKVKEGRFTMSSILSALNKLVGVIVVIYIGNKWSNYLQLLHENQFYFSSIKVSIRYNNFIIRNRYTVLVYISHPKYSIFLFL